MATPISEPGNESGDRPAEPALTARSRTMNFLLRQVGRRGAALLFFAMLDGVYAYSLLYPPANLGASLRFVTTFAPLHVWGMLWAAVGLTCLINAFRIRDRAGFAAAMIVKVVWGLLYLIGALQGVERAYVGAALWLSMGAWVAIIGSWPEPPAGPAQTGATPKPGR